MDKNIRIAIIGGGPAGLGAAMYLEKKDTQIMSSMKRPIMSAESAIHLFTMASVMRWELSWVLLPITLSKM